MAGYIEGRCRGEFNSERISFDLLAAHVRSLVASGAAEPLDLFRTYYYQCPPYQGNPPTKDERDRFAAYRKFTTALEYLDRFEVREGRLEFRGLDSSGQPIFQQKRVDLLLGLDIALLSGKGRITHVALLAGDGDFVPAVDVAKAEGVNVCLFHGPAKSRSGRSTYAVDLWKKADQRFEIDMDFISKVRRS